MAYIKLRGRIWKEQNLKILPSFHKNGQEQKLLKKSPAVTIVEECNKLLTGVGPDIALVNQPVNNI